MGAFPFPAPPPSPPPPPCPLSRTLTPRHHHPIVQIKKTGGMTKFKVRCSKYLYTLCVKDAIKADKLKQTLPPGTYTGK